MKKALTILLLLVAQRGFSQLVYDTRNDAGSGTTSGFFETSAPVNYPTNTAGVWWHLIDVRHTNTANNYRMQFAGPFADQKLYFRKTNNSATTAWSKVLLETAGTVKVDGGVSIGEVSAPAAGGLSIGNLTADYTPTTSNYTTSGSTLFLNSKDYSTIGFHDAGTRVDFIRAGQGTIKIGYNGGWGEPNVGLPGNGIWNNSGNVGIGTITPAAKLDVNGTCRIGTAGGLATFSSFAGSALAGVPGSTFGMQLLGPTNGHFVMDIVANDPDDGFYVRIPTTPVSTATTQTVDKTAFVVKASGFVGIGTSTPREALSVNGNIRAHQVKVETTGWGDYVFADEYKLISLKNLESYIDQNKHLPEIPSASEMEKEGINLGEMNKILVKKVEELTLYIIEGDKLAREQQEQINKLNEKLDRLLNSK